jgi:hypothetical protein
MRASIHRLAIGDAVFLWFVVFSILGVYFVFRDEQMDYRMVAVGSLLPDVVDGALRRGIGPLHSVVVAVVLLFGVVAATVGRRSARKRLLPIPIGVFAHQVLDASWAVTNAFWWPVKGLRLTGRLPLLEHGLAVGLVEEVVAVLVGVAMWRSFGLGNPARRARFRSTGHLPQQRPKQTNGLSRQKDANRPKRPSRGQ